jgi:transposase-like protein
MEDARSNAYPVSLREEAVRLYLEQNGFRRIGRLLRVNHQTVVNWIREREKEQPPAPQPEQSEVIEMDELYAVHLKRGTSSSSPPPSTAPPAASSASVSAKPSPGKKARG